jgi:hypothetical protein
MFQKNHSNHVLLSSTGQYLELTIKGLIKPRLSHLKLCRFRYSGGYGFFSFLK